MRVGSCSVLWRSRESDMGKLKVWGMNKEEEEAFKILGVLGKGGQNMIESFEIQN